MTTEHLGKGYAPLPQSISNTDTEEDDEHHDERHLNHQETETREMIGTNSIGKNGRFYPLDETHNLDNRIRNERNTLSYNDDIPIMVLDGEVNNDLWKRHDMSPVRRFCLVLSILVCILTILIFLYVLPCDDSVICPQTVELQSSISWDKTLDGVELHGPISIVPGTPYNLIFLLRGQQYGKENSKGMGREPIPSDGGGVLSMQGNSGTPLWWVPLKRLPTDINCVVLDTDGSGNPDCLVAGEKGLLVSIEPTSGTIHWSSTLYTYSKLPILLPDINDDQINDLMTVELDKANKNLVLLSGKTGQLLARHKTTCQFIELQNLDSNATVSYFCHNTNAKQSTQLIPLYQLIDIINSSQQELQRKLKINAHTTSYNKPLSQQVVEDNWELAPYYRLHVKNQGVCPSESCRVSVNLTVQHKYNKSRSIWDHVSLKSFATKPAILNTTGQPYSIGFALKFWHFNDSNVDPTSLISDDIVKRTWTERVLIFCMNHTEVREINPSQSEVVQLCRGDDCQPNFKLQNYSIAVADLNNDGLWDLINYRTSYNLNQPKVLSSKVQIIQLDSVP